MKLKKYMSSCHLFCMCDWLECVKWAKAHGFNGIELFGSENGTIFEKIPEERVEKIADFAHENGIELSLHPWTDWTHLSDEALFEIYTQYAEKCAKMGMKYINMHMQFVTTREMGMNRLFRATDKILPILKKAGIILLYENVPPHGIRELGSETNDFKELFAYYRDEKTVQMNIDTGHAHITDTMASLAKEHPARWAYTHINDNFGINDDHVAPGDGTMDFSLVAEYASEVHYTGPLMMEYHEKGLEKGLAVLSDAFEAFGYQL